MTVHTYKEIISKAQTIKTNVEKTYSIGLTLKWGYYFAKAITTPNKDITILNIKDPSGPTGTPISQQIVKADYLDLAKRIVSYVEKNKQIPNYVTYKNYRISTPMYTFMFAKILVWMSNNKNAYPSYVETNTKVFTKPTESGNDVYDYFVKVFGSFGDTIDGALTKIAGKGYGYYYDDVYSNKTSIDRMKAGKGVNCTDSCHVFYNIMQALIKKGKYKKVECLHVKCSGGDGHVRLRITHNNGNTFLRDPAAVLSSGSVTYNWCTSGYTLLAVNPSWFLQNLNR